MAIRRSTSCSKSTVPAGSDGTNRGIADVTVSYVNMASKAADRITRTAITRFTKSPALVESGTNRAVMASAIEQIGVERNQLAVNLRDPGAGSRKPGGVLLENAAFLAENARRYESKEL